MRVSAGVSVKKLLAVAGAGIFAASLFTLRTEAAGLPRYGRVQAVSGETFSVNVHSLEADSFFSCTLLSLACAEIASSSAALSPVALNGKAHVLSSDRALALLVGSSGSASTTLSLVAIEGDALRPLKEILLSAPLWKAFFSSDGTRLVIITKDNRVTVFDVAGGAKLSEWPFVRERTEFITLSPNGRFLAFYKSATLSGDDRSYSLMNLDTGVAVRRAESLVYWDLLSEEGKLFSFAPDSSHLLYLSDEQGQPTLYQVDLTKPLGKKLAGKRIITRSYSVSDFLHWDNERIFLVANREHPLTWSLYYFNIRKRKIDKITDGVSYALLLKRVGNHITFSKLDSKGAVPYVYDVKGDALSEVNVVSVSGAPHPNPDPISAKPRFLKLSGGGTAVLYVPDGFSAKRTYPLVAWLHGGPYRQTNAGYHPYGSYGMFDWTLEKLRAQGTAVLKVDYRGSYGYGRKFAESLREKVGKGDVADVLEAVTLARGRLKVGKVYLMGNSYGGYLALRTLVEKPSSFEGAVSVSGVTDWMTLVGAYAESIFRVHFGGTPDEEKFAPRYNQASVADRASRLTTQRVLLFHGKDDTSVSFRQAQLMHDFLKSIKKNVEIVPYEGEDHVFAKKATASDMCARVLTFMGYGKNSAQCQLD